MKPKKPISQVVSVCCDLVTRGLVNIKIPKENDVDLGAFNQRVEKYLAYECDAEVHIRRLMLFNNVLYRWIDLTDINQISNNCQIFVATANGMELPQCLPPPREASLSVTQGKSAEVEAWWERAINEDPSLIILRSLVAEYVGTLVHSMLVTCSIVFTPNPAGNLGPAFVTGAVMAALTISLSKYSTAQFNPTVTLAMMVCKKTSLAMGLLGMLLQLLGAITGVTLALGATPGGDAAIMQFRNASLIVTPNVPFVTGHAVLGEAVSSFIISLTVLCMIDTGKREVMTHAAELSKPEAGIAIGSIYFATHAVFSFMYPSMSNPARALAMAIVGQDYYEPWEVIWVFTVIPILGALMSGIIFILLVEHENSKKKRVSNTAPAAEHHVQKMTLTPDEFRVKSIRIVGRDRSEVQAHISPNATHADHLHPIEAWANLSECWISDETGALITLTYFGVTEGGKYFIHTRKDGECNIKRSNESLLVSTF